MGAKEPTITVTNTKISNMDNNNLFERVSVAGPFGDCSSHYSYKLQEQPTVEQLVQYINSKQEWGTVYLNPKNWLGDGSLAKFEYNNHGGNRKLEIPQFFHSVCIKKLEAHGGWSNMDYYVMLEPKFTVGENLTAKVNPKYRK